jgi:hypothetical protein
MIMVAILIRFSKQDKRIKTRQFYGYLIGGILGLLYLFARHEALPYLSDRIVLFAIITGLLVWLVYLTIWMGRYVPRIRDEREMAERFEKYLPKQKKKPTDIKKTRKVK